MTQFLEDFLSILAKIKDLSAQGLPTEPATSHQESPSSLDLAAFFSSVRGTLFGGRLTSGQVQGMESKLAAFEKAGWPLSWAAYALATSYHETARRMLPVREGLSASETWRRKHLRYYPYYGRGDVQLTWRENYAKADKELELKGALLSDLDLALDPDISARIMVRGMAEGWFSKGHSLPVHLPDVVGTKAQFKQARRIINIMDKAALIADIAIKFQDALKGAGYGHTNPR